MADYSQSGAASFSTSGGTLSFAAGQNAKIITIDPKTDRVLDANETVILTVVAITG